MNIRRAWTLCSPSCRPSASRTAARNLDTKFFSSSARTDYSHHSWRRPCETPATQSVLSQALSHLSRHTLSFHQTSPALSRLGWYRESAAKNVASVKRGSGLSGSSRRPGPGRSPYDSQSRGPLEQLRRWFNKFPSEFVVWGIIGLNGAVFFAWQYAYDRAQHGEPSLYISMQRNVQNSWRNIREGRVWSIIASTFSHSSVGHIFLNCLSFYFIAPPIVNLIGNSSFMSLYFLGGISCSMLSLLLNQSVSRREGASHGASGAIFAVMSFFACVSPKTKFLIFGVVPAPAWAVVTGFFIWDGLSALSDRRTVIDGAGHVGGILAGVAYYLMKRRLFF